MNQPLHHRTWVGVTLGFITGVADILLIRSLGVEMRIAGIDATLGVMLFFAMSFAMFGAVISVLLARRAQISMQGRVIAEQYDELQIAQQALVEAQTLAVIGRMASGVAHEVRNPLGVIKASASLIRDDLDPVSDSFEAATFICEEVDQLDHFVAELLDFARPVELEMTRVEVADLFERLERQLAMELEHVELDAQIASDARLVRVDEAVISRALLGLAQNALAAMEGEGRLLFRSWRRPAGEVILAIADSGPGVPNHERERVFEPFFTTKASGTGLGLAMAQKIARAHGGGLELFDGRGAGVDGAGACFGVVLENLEV